MPLPRNSIPWRPPESQEVLVLAEDLLIQNLVESRMRNSSHRELRHITCEFHEGVLTLRGRVSSHYLKQLAQTMVLHLEQVHEVNNRLEVCPPEIGL